MKCIHYEIRVLRSCFVRPHRKTSADYIVTADAVSKIVWKIKYAFALKTLFRIIILNYLN